MSDLESRIDWQKAEHDLGQAYLRLRAMIPGAFRTGYAPTPEEVWKTTEASLARFVEEYNAQQKFIQKLRAVIEDSQHIVSSTLNERPWP